MIKRTLAGKRISKMAAIARPTLPRRANHRSRSICVTCATATVESDTRGPTAKTRVPTTRSRDTHVRGLSRGWKVETRFNGRSRCRERGDWREDSGGDRQTDRQRRVSNAGAANIARRAANAPRVFRVAPTTRGGATVRRRERARLPRKRAAGVCARGEFLLFVFAKVLAALKGKKDEGDVR